MFPLIHKRKNFFSIKKINWRMNETQANVNLKNNLLKENSSQSSEKTTNFRTQKCINSMPKNSMTAYVANTISHHTLTSHTPTKHSFTSHTIMDTQIPIDHSTKTIIATNNKTRKEKDSGHQQYKLPQLIEAISHIRKNVGIDLQFSPLFTDKQLIQNCLNGGILQSDENRNSEITLNDQDLQQHHYDEWIGNVSKEDDLKLGKNETTSQHGSHYQTSTKTVTTSGSIHKLLSSILPVENVVSSILNRKKKRVWGKIYLD